MNSFYERVISNRIFRFRAVRKSVKSKLYRLSVCIILLINTRQEKIGSTKDNFPSGTFENENEESIYFLLWNNTKI